MKYYVMVMTEVGPVFVTELGCNHSAMWDMCGKPMELGKCIAGDVSTGLNMNGFPAYVVVSKTAIIQQPYFYNHGKFTWSSKEASK